MPPHLAGALVQCFVAAPDFMSALRLAVARLSEDGCSFESLEGGQVHQMAPSEWDEYVASTWPEIPNHFPPQVDVVRLVQAGGVFLGPFLAWETEH
jgi:hypothetical protein